jgi:hypothetical protein
LRVICLSFFKKELLSEKQKENAWPLVAFSSSRCPCNGRDKYEVTSGYLDHEMAWYREAQANTWRRSVIVFSEIDDDLMPRIFSSRSRLTPTFSRTFRGTSRNNVGVNPADTLAPLAGKFQVSRECLMRNAGRDDTS